MIRQYTLKISCIFVFLDLMLGLLLISYASLLDAPITFIGLHYAGFYNISKAALLLGFFGPDQTRFLKNPTNTVSKVMLVAQRKFKFLPFRI